MINFWPAMSTSMAVRCYFLESSHDAPNNSLPVLHYRNVLPRPMSEESTTKFLTRHAWEKRVRDRCGRILERLIVTIGGF